MKEPVFDALYRPTIVDRAHAKAREYEQVLAEAVTTFSPIELDKLQTEIIDDLNGSCNHIDEKVFVTGIVNFTGIDIAKGIDENREAVKTEVRVSATDVPARSLGYTCLQTVNGGDKRLSIMHKAFADPVPTLTTEVGTIYQSGPLTMPVDGSVDVQLQHEPMPPHTELLDTYIPEVIEDIDDALYNNEGITKQLRGLSKIDFRKSNVLTGRGGSELKEQVAAYINRQLDIELQGFCYIAGTKEVIIPTEDGYGLAQLEKFRAVGIPQMVQFSPVDGDERLVLMMTVPFHRRGLQEIMYVLNSRITLTPAPQLLME